MISLKYDDPSGNLPFNYDSYFSARTLGRINSYFRDNTDKHTAVAGALPSPAVQCI